MERTKIIREFMKNLKKDFSRKKKIKISYLGWWLRAGNVLGSDSIRYCGIELESDYQGLYYNPENKIFFYFGVDPSGGFSSNEFFILTKAQVKLIPRLILD